MEKSAKDQLVNDIENRLDDFFGDEDDPEPTAEVRPSMEKLKSAVLSIDWEITDACLNDLKNEVEALLPHYEKEPVTHALLRMLRALGGYIRKRKAQAHQDAIKRVMSVFASLESLVNNPQMDESRRRQLVSKEIIAFKKLKEQVEQRRAAASAADGTATGEKAPLDVHAILEHRQFQDAVNAVEARLSSQVAALKAELASLQAEIKTLKH